MRFGINCKVLVPLRNYYGSMFDADGTIRGSTVVRLSLQHQGPAQELSLHAEVPILRTSLAQPNRSRDSSPDSEVQLSDSLASATKASLSYPDVYVSDSMAALPFARK